MSWGGTRPTRQLFSSSAPSLVLLFSSLGLGLIAIIFSHQNVLASAQEQNSMGSNKNPIITVTEIDKETLEPIQVLEKEPNSDIVAGEDTGIEKRVLQFECAASYPIQWIYLGDGTPEFTSNTSTKWDENEFETTEFQAVISLGQSRQLSEKDFGKYICRSIQKPYSYSSYFFLYVPGNELFVKKGGENITLYTNSRNLRIPCSVTHPNITVTLQKAYNGLVHCPINESITFDPRQGFNLKVNELSHAEGIFVCTASWNRTTYRVIEYTVNVMRVMDSNSNEFDGSSNEIDRPPQLKPPPPSGPINNNNNNHHHHHPHPNHPSMQNPQYEETCSAKEYCGRNAECKINPRNNLPYCRCLGNYKGNPYVGCNRIDRPESIQSPTAKPGKMNEHCEKNTDCEKHLGCVENRCADVCKENKICGKDAHCEVVNHIPRCYCPDQLIGNPYQQCKNISDVSTPAPDPCSPNPCGPYSKCTYNSKVISCVCQPRTNGAPPNCRPECIDNADCPNSRICYENKCEDPCVQRLCGPNTFCQSLNRRRVCSCRPGYTGDPYDVSRGCLQALKRAIDPLQRPCNIFHKSPCGENSNCVFPAGGGRITCECIGGFRGDPVRGCFKNKDSEDPLKSVLGDTCSDHSDCPENLACFTDKKMCDNPCEFTDCPENHICDVKSHRPMCINKSDEEAISLTSSFEARIEENPCTGDNSCGMNTECVKYDNGNEIIANCTCLSGYVGNPNTSKGCERPPCKNDNDCESMEQCIDEHCDDPCFHYDCGPYVERCSVWNHKPVCSCTKSKTLFRNSCFQKPEEDYLLLEKNKTHLGLKLEHLFKPLAPNRLDCRRALCGNNAKCVETPSGEANCQCDPYTNGDPYKSCEFECLLNSDCPKDKYCNAQNKICEDPCEIRDVCGQNANCTVVNHTPNCHCPNGTTGQAFNMCMQIKKMETSDLIMSHHPEPETCHTDFDCALTHACFLYGKGLSKCGDPCSQSFSICGKSAECRVRRHVSHCSCPSGYTGNPGVECLRIPPDEDGHPLHRKACDQFKNKCGNGAYCQRARKGGRNSYCNCKKGFVGDPYSECKEALNCEYNYECPSNRLCEDKECIDPCVKKVGLCGVNQKCLVENHRPTCTCNDNYIWKLGNCYPNVTLFKYLEIPNSEYYYGSDFYQD